MDFKDILGGLAVLIAFAGYCVYFRQIFFGNVRPHAFSWFIWSILTGIGFVAQVVENGGAGAWTLGFSSIVTFLFFLISLRKGERQFVKADWLFLSAASFALLLWWFTKDPTLSVILVAITDATAAIPTFRKAFHKPWEDSATLFGLNSLKSAVSLFALSSFSLATWFYPTSLVFTNGLIVLTLLIRRKRVEKSSAHTLSGGF